MITYKQKAKYWKERCLAAEELMRKSSGRPHIMSDEECEAFEKWAEIRDEEELHPKTGWLIPGVSP